ncbi:hypothetical protein [Algoriphagus chordae]|uniref:Uncharacterized protein n=1 Tax=Algoriphagus chordae TaxID=237019 RepID=A0A2W7QTN5_9BACT|nr:hypothetical protein [Algoriphagus chordae]PZX51351.1 hypothetical protein LV85_02295 [Algoriphagus chordae]
MKKSIYPILFCLLFSFACEEKDDPATVCGVSDPIESLPWLKQLVEEASTAGLAEYSYISKAKYNGHRVFYWGSCCPHCNWALVLLDCSGEKVNGDYTLSDLQEIEVIWHLENSQCNFN